jgi:hypothetical protein
LQQPWPDRFARVNRHRRRPTVVVTKNVMAALNPDDVEAGAF